MDRKYLMEIHDEFEVLANNPVFMMSPQVPIGVKEALVHLNILIHKYENIYRQKNQFHIDAQFIKPASWCFEDKDYQLFTPNLNSGTLYLDYGITGVPVLNAFPYRC